MSGGGGGGSSKPKTDTATTTPMQTVQPGMPGQISTLADQLAAGFGQNPADILTQLQQYYQPMSIPNYAPGATGNSGSSSTSSGSTKPNLTARTYSSHLASGGNR